jgi:hypothetical protein
MADGQAAHLPELDSFQMGPQALSRIQFWGVGRSAFNVASVRSASRQELLESVTWMDRRPIPDDHQAACPFAQPILQKGHNIDRVQCPCLAGNVQMTLWGDGADGREMVAGPPLLPNGRLAYRGMHADATGQGIASRFV